MLEGLRAAFASMMVAGKEVGAWLCRGDAGRWRPPPLPLMLPLMLRMEFEREDMGEGWCRWWMGEEDD